MEEGELYAIETFGSTGKGVVHEDLECRCAAASLKAEPLSGLGLEVTYQHQHIDRGPPVPVR